MPFADAAATFTTLTVGDGLVSQIPALLVSTAAGIVVTKGATEGSADAALMRQLGGNPKPLALAGGAAMVLALMPGYRRCPSSPWPGWPAPAPGCATATPPACPMRRRQPPPSPPSHRSTKRCEWT